ncbi:(2Fe-2S) ferredoxin domain-containing protein [Anaerobranca gottschalkii]|uniref:NAD(P)-dependent iron-only hydrogenase iron-sulfur protein n=1 Tax=Anaerobranca gottschalkii DSM 13577 TaxID=1120990 RepID=A0A1H9Y9H0_9FIRM|nr:(2Fe-2S) ferredoxin domain-containing protein [Anaerobranca gottschalkii]SES65482.1 NAD(P)-dependent iron-only hydrogenase iron-sulfur protein [Anaerobranca gottschalkii DSM 13577]
MSKIKSLEDLRKLREEQSKLSTARESDHPTVIVGMGTCGIAAGARDVMLTILEEINKRNLKVNITQTGCIGMCQHEPLVDVVIPGQDRITYGRVTKDLAKKIVVEHLANGNILKDAVIGKIEKQ